MKRIRASIVLGTCLALTSSCTGDKFNLFTPENPDIIDTSLKLTRNDYKNVNDIASYGKLDASGAKTAINPAEPPIPDLAEILATPQPPKLGETQLVSVAVTDDVPLKDVLIELARLADVDIEVDASITGGISFRAKDRPFNEVIDRITNLADLRYTMKNNVLRVERDTPYVQTYSLDFLNLERASSSNVNISTSVLSSGGGSGGLSNGSSSTITAKEDNDFWKQFEESVKRILNYKESKRISEATMAEQPGAPVTAGSTPAPAAAQSAAAAASSGGGSGSGSGGGLDGAFYILNRQASTLTISATDRQHAMLKEFIRRVKTNASAQVLIEAKVVEIALNDQFQSGIDWTKLQKVGTGLSFNGIKFGGVTDAANIGTLAIAENNFLGIKNLDLTAAVQLAESFGTTRTLSSPRLHAMNNQEAVLTAADNEVYYTLTVTAPTTTTTGTVSTTPTAPTVTSTLHTIPIGIILSIQPSIDTDTDEITMDIRPTLSRIVSTVNDPGVAITVAQIEATTPASLTGSALAAFQASLAGITSPVPIVEVREMDSVLKVKSGQVMVIGGLMQDIGTNTDTGIPYVSSIPWLGNLFKGVDRHSQVNELVIFVRATVVGTGNDVDQIDKSFYQKFTKDPHPI